MDCAYTSRWTSIVNVLNFGFVKLLLKGFSSETQFIMNDTRQLTACSQTSTIVIFTITVFRKRIILVARIYDIGLSYLLGAYLHALWRHSVYLAARLTGPSPYVHRSP